MTAILDDHGWGEADPTPFRDTDEWFPLAEIIELVDGYCSFGVIGGPHA